MRQSFQRNDTPRSSAASSLRFEMATGCVWLGGQLPVIFIAALAAGYGLPRPWRVPAEAGPLSEEHRPPPRPAAARPTCRRLTR